MMLPGYVTPGLYIPAMYTAMEEGDGAEYRKLHLILCMEECLESLQQEE
jgi:hypothetical protein